MLVESLVARTAMVEVDVKVRCVDGRTRRYVNLDYAASTPAMAGVLAIVQDFATWYGNEDESELGTAAYEAAHGAVAEFVGARDGTVVLVRNTAEAIGRPRRRAAGGHARPEHGRGLPWGDHDVTVLPAPANGAELVERCEHALRVARSPIDLVAVPGASSLTGEVWPLAELAAVAHHYGARLFVDATRLASHRAIDMAETGIDYLALSGDMLYAPFGSSRARRLRSRRRARRAGFAQRGGCGRPRRGLPDAGRGRDGLRGGTRARPAGAPRGGSGATSPACSRRCRRTTAAVDRIGAATFELEGYRAALLAAILGAEHAIGVAHALSGTVRVSFGVATTAHDVDRLVDALAEIARYGPRWAYVHDRAHDEYHPAPDMRALSRSPRYEPAAASASARPLRS